MREIKFRAWVKDATTGEWRMCNRVRWLDLDNQRICTESGMQPDEFVLMQYIGLQDKHGREVYEGDIVRGYDDHHEPIFGVVTFRDGSFVIKNPAIAHFRWMDYTLEVIGNAYENPELLE